MALGLQFTVGSGIFARPLHPALLVSVRSAEEARIACSAGVDILDIKEPAHGSLGMASLECIAEITRVRDELSPATPVSVALGELIEWDQAPQSLRALSSANLRGIALCKLGAAGMAGVSDWRPRYRTAFQNLQRGLTVSGGQPPAGIAVAYADWKRADAPAPEEVCTLAIELGCAGLLIDTYAKQGGRWSDELSVESLRQLADRLHAHGLLFALAGRVALEDVPALLEIGPDVVGIRSAACHEGRREAEIDPSRVQAFRQSLTSGVNCVQ